MKQLTRRDVIRMVEEEDVEFIRLQFTAVLGNFKNLAVTSSQLEKVLNNECAFDGSAIDGYARAEESDMYLYPDYNTFEIFPWRPQQGKVARMICDVYYPDGEPFQGDPRYVLKRALKNAEKMGYTFDVGTECEFFLFNTDDDTMPTTNTNEQAGYFDLGPLDFGENARRDMVMTLEDMGFVVESSHHEQAPAQHEIDFMHDEALATADNIMTFRLAVRTIARRHGLHATFMPKPKADVDGSGMHLHMNLIKDGKNIFADPADPLGLSKEAYYFIGGLMKHIKGITAVANPLVNSYKRLAPGFDAPAYIAWGAANRSPLIRIPSTGKGEAKRIELCSPDPAANPYLTLALCLEAGLDGIRNQIQPPEGISGNLFKMTQERRDELGVERLPESLKEALAELKKDSLLMEALGEHVAESYLEAKAAEWEKYRKQVSEWEIQEYLYKY
ncbi:MAG: type I glutamate--ammonia ligase [Lachnospiraceae bacterium]|nr:type I glutamate--ammonia ligase [Lachnospiraceae bacterium]